MDEDTYSTAIAAPIAASGRTVGCHAVEGACASAEVDPFAGRAAGLKTEGGPSRLA